MGTRFYLCLGSSTPHSETQLTFEMKGSRSWACQSQSGLCFERGFKACFHF